jgi:hypothetical protein
MRRNPESSALGVAPVAAILVLGLVLLIRSSHPAAADPPDVACSSEKPIAAITRLPRSASGMSEPVRGSRSDSG